MKEKVGKEGGAGRKKKKDGEGDDPDTESPKGTPSAQDSRDYFLYGGCPKFVDTLVKLHAMKSDLRKIEQEYGKSFMWQIEVPMLNAGDGTSKLLELMEKNNGRRVLYLESDVGHKEKVLIDVLYIKQVGDGKGEKYFGLFAARSFKPRAILGFCSGELVKRHFEASLNAMAIEEEEEKLKLRDGGMEMHDEDESQCIVNSIDRVLEKEPHLLFFGMNYLRASEDKELVNCFIEEGGTVVAARQVKKDEELQYYAGDADDEDEEEEEKEEEQEEEEEGAKLHQLANLVL